MHHIGQQPCCTVLRMEEASGCSGCTCGAAAAFLVRFSAGLEDLGRFSADRVLGGMGFAAGAAFPAAVEAGAGEEPAAEGPAPLAAAALPGAFAAVAVGAASALFLAAGPRRVWPLVSQQNLSGGYIERDVEPFVSCVQVMAAAGAQRTGWQGAEGKSWQRTPLPFGRFCGRKGSFSAPHAAALDLHTVGHHISAKMLKLQPLRIIYLDCQLLMQEIYQFDMGIRAAFPARLSSIMDRNAPFPFSATGSLGLMALEGCAFALTLLFKPAAGLLCPLVMIS